MPIFHDILSRQTKKLHRLHFLGQAQVSVCVLAKYTAKSLLGNGTNGWNDQLVHYIFLSHDAKEILNMRTASFKGQCGLALGKEGPF
jgi:hypothetical protein